MKDYPTAITYAGTDIETMSKEELIVVIKQAVRERDMFVKMHKSSIEMSRAFREYKRYEKS